MCVQMGRTLCPFVFLVNYIDFLFLRISLILCVDLESQINRKYVCEILVPGGPKISAKLKYVIRGVQILRYIWTGRN